MSKSQKKSKNQQMEKGIESHFDTKITRESLSIDKMDLRNQEDICNNKVLFNHLIKIQNIDQKILSWDKNINIDEEETKNLLKSFDYKSIKVSLQSSCFKKYLVNSVSDKEEKNYSTCGVVLSYNENGINHNKDYLNNIQNGDDLTNSEKKNSIIECIESKPREQSQTIDSQPEILTNQISDILTIESSEEQASMDQKELENGVQIKDELKIKTDTHLAETNDNNESPSLDTSTPSRSRRHTTRLDYKSMAAGERFNKRRISEDIIKKPTSSQIIESNNISKSHNSVPVSTNCHNISQTQSKKVKSKSSTYGHCVSCKTGIKSTNTFQNICKTCNKLLDSCLEGCQSQYDMICLNKPPCFQLDSDKTKCHACTIQHFIVCGVKSSDSELEQLLNVDIDELRNSDNVDKAILQCIVNGEEYLATVSEHERNTAKSCLLRYQDGFSYDYEWDNNLFQLVTEIDKDFVCHFCCDSKTHLYKLIRANNTLACNDCIIRTHRLLHEYEGNVWNICKNVTKCESSECDGCFIKDFFVFCPPDGVLYRFKSLSSIKLGCRLCLNENINSIVQFSNNKQFFICLVCLWRIKLYYLKSKEKCKHRFIDISLQCDACLVDLASRFAPMHEYISQKPISSNMEDNIDCEPPVKKPKLSEDEKENRNENIELIPPESKKRKVSGSEENNAKIRKIESQDVKEPKENQIITDSAGRSSKRKHKAPAYFGEYEDSNEVSIGVETCDKINKEKIETINFNDLPDAIIKSNLLTSTSVRQPRIKSAVPRSSLSSENNLDSSKDDDALNLDEIVQQTKPSPVVKLTGPRVKNVSRHNVSDSALNLDSGEKSSVKKSSNNSSVAHDDEITEENLTTSIENDDIDDTQEMTEETINVKPDIEPPSEDSLMPDNTFPCGHCKNCRRNKICGKCNKCRTRKDKKNLTEQDLIDLKCIHMICLNPTTMKDAVSKSNTKNLIHNSPQSGIESDETIVLSTEPVSVGNVIYGATKPLSESFQAVDSPTEVETTAFTPTSSIDPIINNLDVTNSKLSLQLDERVLRKSNGSNTSQPNTHNTSNISKSGFAIVTTKRAAPSKVLCFQCGSSGEHMLHCIDCAEPYHFFCIDLVFRPSSHELFKCSKCTPCAECCIKTSASALSVDLKCIKCHMGYHRKCLANFYPPARSNDVKWACHKCALCLHCGVNAVSDTSTAWSKDPWQCKSCYEKRESGDTCVCCHRSNSSPAETIACSKCKSNMHRQCALLTEDELAILQLNSHDQDQPLILLCNSCCTSRTTGLTTKPRRSTLLNDFLHNSLQKRMEETISKGLDQERNIFQSICRNSNGSAERVNGRIIQTDGLADDDSVDSEMDEDTQQLEDTMKNRDANLTSNCSNINNSTESLNDVDMQEEDDDDEEDISLTHIYPGLSVFNGLIVENYKNCRHLLIELVARILYKTRSNRLDRIKTAYYHKMIKLTRQLSEDLMPWIDFAECMSKAKECFTRHSTRSTNLVRLIAEHIDKQNQCELRVYQTNLEEIESKLSMSFIKIREDFIEFHTESQCSALERSVTMNNARGGAHSNANNNNNYTKYELAFPCQMNYEYEDYSQQQKQLHRRNYLEKDPRFCILCHMGGDDNIEGRLLYGGGDIWIHVNCALWSDEVFEQEDGYLQNVHEAVQRGSTTQCIYCNRPGATLSCCARDSLYEDDDGTRCINIFHLNCAFNYLDRPVFTTDNTFFCSEIHETVPRPSKSPRLQLRDMLILRPVYLPRNCLVHASDLAVQEPIESEDIVVTIGALKIESLGKIAEEASGNNKLCLSPVGYNARRLFWSTFQPDTLVLYFMAIKLEQNKNYQCSTTGEGISVGKSSTIRPRRSKKVLETSEYRMKKKQYRKNHDNGVNNSNSNMIVYEMDDDGNLRALSNNYRTVYHGNSRYTDDFLVNTNRSVVNIEKKKRKSKSSTITSEMSSNRPQNRRFPIKKQTKERTKRSESNHSFVNVVKQSDVEEEEDPEVIQAREMELAQYHQQQEMLKQNPPPFLANLHNQQQQIQIQQKIQQNQIKQQIQQHQIHRHVSMPLTNQSQKIIRAPLIPALPVINQQKIIKIKNISNQVISRSPSNIGPVFRANPQIRMPYNPSSLSTTSTINGTTQNQILRTFLTGQTSIVTHSPKKFTPGNMKESNVTIAKPTILASGSLYPQNIVNRPHQLVQPNSINFITPSQLDGVEDLSEVEDGQYNAESIVTRAEDMDEEMYSVASKKSTVSMGTCIENRVVLKYLILGASIGVSPKKCWNQIMKKVVQLHHPPSGYVTNNRTDGWSKFGLTHPVVIYLTELLKNSYRITGDYEFKMHRARTQKLRDDNNMFAQGINGGLSQFVVAPDNSSRNTQWNTVRSSERSHDPLDFLHCRANKPLNTPNFSNLEDNGTEEYISPYPDPEDSEYVQSLADQYTTLKSGHEARINSVEVYVSQIHGRGLFARRDFHAHEVVIEYLGELIRPSISDIREREYQKKGVDCYMFRLDRNHIVDATCKGNAARFINHSCSPNCYAKLVQLNGVKHIIIIASEKIRKGHEMTYDYQFPYEDEKLPCTCRSSQCRKYLN